MLKKIINYKIVVLSLLFVGNTLVGMDDREARGNPLDSSVSVRTYQEDIRDNVSVLAQSDAVEFCQKMHHSFTSLFPNSPNHYVRAWGEFFKSIIFQGEMGIKVAPYGKPVDMDSILGDISDVPQKHTKQSQELSVLFLSVSGKNRSALEVRHLDIFINKLNATSFKTLKEKNSYALFMDGFLDLIQGVQNRNLQKKKDGQYKLVLSAYGLNGLALEVLKDMGFSIEKTRKVSKKHEILLKPIVSKLLEDCIKEQYFLEGEELLFINSLGKSQYNQYQMIRKKMFERLIYVFHQILSDEKQTYYVDINEYLRSRLLEKRDAVSLYSTISWKLSVIVPFILDLSTPIMNIIAYNMIASEDDNKIARDIIIAGAVIAFIMPFFILAQGIYQWWSSLGTVLYSEDQIQMTALYYSMVYGLPHETAGGIVQPFIDYLDEKKNKDKTLTQYAVEFRKGKLK